jgi:PAS domain S-box-containing protein
MMVLSFRTFVAFRSGIFPRGSRKRMREDARLVKDYSDTLRLPLSALTDLCRTPEFEPRQRHAIQQLRQLHQRWRRASTSVASLCNSGTWRADIPLLKDTIQPLLLQTWSHLHDTGTALLSASAGDVMRITHTVRRLSDALWRIFLFSVGATALMYFLIEYAVRRPVAHAAAALQAEMPGASPLPVNATPTQATRALLHALDRMRQQVRARQLHLEAILTNAAEAIVTFNSHGVIESINNAAVRQFGYHAAEAIGQDLGLLLPPLEPHDQPPVNIGHRRYVESVRPPGYENEGASRHKDGTPFPVAFKVCQIILAGRALYTGLVSDISERTALLEHLKTQAEQDALTGRYNRSYFMTELERVVERTRRRESHCALRYVDLENF